MICLITGGARSGKTRYAQEAALALSSSPVYVATARLQEGDEEFRERVDRHRQQRDERWTSLEEPLRVSLLPLENKVVVVDCVTLWLSNIFSHYQYDVQSSLNALQQEITALSKMDARLLIISNEIGMGIHGDTPISRKFTDLQGWANQSIAQLANQVILMVSGIPVIIKDDK